MFFFAISTLAIISKGVLSSGEISLGTRQTPARKGTGKDAKFLENSLKQKKSDLITTRVTYCKRLDGEAKNKALQTREWRGVAKGGINDFCQKHCIEQGGRRVDRDASCGTREMFLGDGSVRKREGGPIARRGGARRTDNFLLPQVTAPLKVSRSPRRSQSIFWLFKAKCEVAQVFAS